MTPGDDVTGKDFGIWRTGEVSGLQFADTDGDGTRDTDEPAEQGWTVYADLDGDAEHDSGEPSAVTADDGGYTVAGLHPGSVVLREVAQDGRACTAPASCRHVVALVSFGSVSGSTPLLKQLP